MAAYEPVIGLEVHAQLKTRTKIFCGCPTDFGAPPNSQTCTICLGHPGALPVLNRRAVELALRAATALGCEIRRRSVFERKNYFYPDLPKGYQISQYAEPLAVGGSVQIEVEGERREIELERMHLEEDAGKLLHDGGSDASYSRVDCNRAGIPLIEIVSRPEIRSPAEAYLLLQRLRSLLRYADVCDGNMEQGSLRCDANVSVRPRGDTVLGTRSELKNLNSFRNVERALEHEIARQIRELRSGRRIVQQTVLWDAQAGETRPMRGKEEADDYRYFPDPDLPPLEVDEAWVREIRAQLPVLPAERKQSIISRHGLDEREAHLLTLEQPLADYYEEVAVRCGVPKAAANWVLNDLQRELNARGLDETRIPVAAVRLAELIDLVEHGTVSVTAARRDLFPRLFDGDAAPAELARELGLQQVSDVDRLESLVDRVVAEHPRQVEQYRAGKTGLLGFFVGRVMRASDGSANPRVVSDLLRRKLG